VQAVVKQRGGMKEGGIPHGQKARKGEVSVEEARAKSVHRKKTKKSDRNNRLRGRVQKCAAGSVDPKQLRRIKKEREAPCRFRKIGHMSYSSRKLGDQRMGGAG